MKRDPIPARPAEPPAAAAATDIYAPLRDLDRLRTASLARMSFGLSPQSLWLAWSDWAMHLATAPGKQIELAMRLSRSMTDAFNDAMQSAVAGPDTSATTHAAEPTVRTFLQLPPVAWRLVPREAAPPATPATARALALPPTGGAGLGTLSSVFERSLSSPLSAIYGAAAGSDTRSSRKRRDSL